MSIRSQLFLVRGLPLGRPRGFVFGLRLGLRFGLPRGLALGLVLGLAAATGCVSGTEDTPDEAAAADTPADSETAGADPDRSEAADGMEGTTAVPDPGSDGAHAYVFTCPDGRRFSARFRGDSVTLRLPDRTDTVTRQAATHSYRGCEAHPAADPWEEARLLGVEVRAIGQEPGWHVEIDGGSWLRFVADYGALRLFAPAPTPTRSGGGVITYATRADGHELTVEMVEEPCSDTMSGERFSHRVTARVDGRELHGCGRILATDS